MRSTDETKRIIHCVDNEGEKISCPTDKLVFRPSAYAIVLRGMEDGGLVLKTENAAGFVCHEASILVVDTKFGLTLPGGRIEVGEDHETALEREVFEETSIRVKYEKVYTVDTTFWHDRGQCYHCLCVFARCEYVAGEPSDANLSEDEKVRWNCKPFWLPFNVVAERGFALTADWRTALRTAFNVR